MSEPEIIKAVDGGEAPPLYKAATRENFAASGLTEFLAERLSADCYALEDAFCEASIKAKVSGEVARERVFGLLTGLMSCHLRIDDPAEVFGSKLVLGDRRSMIPSDVRAEQTTVIADVTPTVAHPLVRARLKGGYRPDSDIELAFVIDGQDEGESLGNAICLRPVWRNELQAMLPVKVPAQPMFDDDEVVAPDVRDHGMLLFRRSELP